MDLKQVVTGGAPDEVTKPIGAFNEALGRLFGEEADAQKADLVLTKTGPYLFLPGLVSKLRVQSIYQDSPAFREEASSKLPWSLSFMIARRRTSERRADSSSGS